jgi:hypothetical protein
VWPAAKPASTIAQHQPTSRSTSKYVSLSGRTAPGDWLITEHLAELTPDGLVETTRGLELAAAIGWG